MLEPKDDLRHHLRPGPHSRESLFYDLVLPDEGLLVFTYTWVNADEQAGHLFAVVADDNEKLAFSAADGVPTGGRDFDDWRVDGGSGNVWVKHTDLLRSASYGAGAQGDGFSAELTVEFTGTHEAFDYARNEDGCPDFIADNRFEQGSRSRGTLTLNGRDIHFDTTGHRDHSWGTRDWDAIQDWKWVSAQVDDDLQLNVMVLHARGETTYHGYVVADGELQPVVHAKTRATYDDNWWQKGLTMAVLDAAGRRTEVTGERYALLNFQAGERITLNEAAFRGTVNGREARMHFENGWDRSYSDAQIRRLGGSLLTGT
ncbi:MAG TPA: hypothetical protein VL595_27000 [Pseudonocardia sp.]|nr:hypothetical protein [Pseudonocardia sp.]